MCIWTQMYSNDIIEYVFLSILTVHWFIYVKYTNTWANFAFETLKFSSFFSYEYKQHYMHDLQHTVMGCSGWPNQRHHYLKGYSLPPLWTTRWHIYNIFYNTTSKYINSDTGIVQWKLVHQTVIHNLPPKNYYEESQINFRCRVFRSFYFPTNQFGIYPY
jgi:hypothetical protein